MYNVLDQAFLFLGRARLLVLPLESEHKLAFRLIWQASLSGQGCKGGRVPHFEKYI